MRKRRETEEILETPLDGAKPFEGDRQFVSALWRGLEVMRAFRPRDEGLTNLELAKRTGFGPSTISRLTYTLVRLGYLTYEERRGLYRLGVAVLSLGHACLAGFGSRAIAQPHMQRLAEMVGHGHLVALSTRDHLSMAYVACARSEGVVSLTLDVGSRISLPRSSAGRAYLAIASEAERRKVLDAIREDTGKEAWPELEASILDGIEQVRARGFCLNLGQWRREVNVVAAPVPALDGSGPHFALSCGGPAYLLPKAKLETEIAPRLLEVVSRITQEAPSG